MSVSSALTHRHVVIGARASVTILQACVFPSYAPRGLSSKWAAQLPKQCMSLAVIRGLAGISCSRQEMAETPSCNTAKSRQSPGVR